MASITWFRDNHDHSCISTLYAIREIVKHQWILNTFERQLGVDCWSSWQAHCICCKCSNLDESIQAIQSRLKPTNAAVRAPPTTYEKGINSSHGASSELTTDNQSVQVNHTISDTIDESQTQYKSYWIELAPLKDVRESSIVQLRYLFLPYRMSDREFTVFGSIALVLSTLLGKVWIPAVWQLLPVRF
jgi:hypothetical protein